MPNIAAIDAGSNAIRMMVSQLNSEGRLETLENLRLPVRLGQDAFTTGQFSEQTMQMAVDAFLRFRKVAEVFEVTQTRAVATSAMRETTNSDLLIERIARETGFSIEPISGDEEARLIHLAVTQAVNLKGKRAILIDIGGGSVEVTLSDGENILSTESYGMGTVRLLKKLESTDGNKLPFNRLVREYAESARRHIDRDIGDEKVEACVGTGGNIEEMGKLRKQLFKRERDDSIGLDELERLVEKLGAMSVAERIKKLDLRPDRADVILPATVVLHMIAREARVKEVLIPGVGLKDGVLLDMAPLALGPSLPRRDQAIASAERMGHKYAYDAEHAIFTARMATSLFNQALSLHHLTENERLLLEIAAMLHDIGHFINTIDHDKHGYYLLRHHPLIGLTSAEQEVVANIVRFHRKETPTAADENFKQLPQRDRLTVTKLCALLRLADGLDTSHTARVRDINLEQRNHGLWQMKLSGEGDSMLEKWTLEKRKALFQDIFGVKLEII
ncbi:MAG: Ppx/GppA family phosphatase [Chloroflexi bacterium]|nr:MAG: Ppx/GppA family phosphatase [Chloroflexota bacterium]